MATPTFKTDLRSLLRRVAAMGAIADREPIVTLAEAAINLSSADLDGELGREMARDMALRLRAAATEMDRVAELADEEGLPPTADRMRLRARLARMYADEVGGAYGLKEDA